MNLAALENLATVALKNAGRFSPDMAKGVKDALHRGVLAPVGTGGEPHYENRQVYKEGFAFGQWLKNERRPAVSAYIEDQYANRIYAEYTGG